MRQAIAHGVENKTVEYDFMGVAAMALLLLHVTISRVLIRGEIMCLQAVGYRCYNLSVQNERYEL